MKGLHCKPFDKFIIQNTEGENIYNRAETNPENITKARILTEL